MAQIDVPAFRERETPHAGKHHYWKVIAPFPSIGGLIASAILGIFLCLLEGVAFHWPVWISLLSWFLATFLLALIATPIFVVRWLRQKNRHEIVLKEEPCFHYPAPCEVEEIGEDEVNGILDEIDTEYADVLQALAEQ